MVSNEEARWTLARREPEPMWADLDDAQRYAFRVGLENRVDARPLLEIILRARPRVQQVLHMTTANGWLRADATGWSAEDPSRLQPGPIGMTPGFRDPYSYATPMHALAAGWHLLAPPERFTNDFGPDCDESQRFVTEWSWWFVRPAP